MQLSRRDFVKALGAGAGSLVVLGHWKTEPVLAATSKTGVQGGKAMLNDASRCVGCRACQTACKKWNGLPAESSGYENIYDNPSSLSAQTWTLIKVKETVTDSNRDLLLCKYQCMHCTDAVCVKVCPTGALSYHPLGFVAYDRNLCSGCGYCGQFCPFQVPRLGGDVLTGVQLMGKCTFCQDRVPDGRQTACAEACPANAILFGDRNEMIAEGKRRVAQLKNTYPRATLYGESELGGLHVIYVLKDSPAVYELPTSPQVPIMAPLWKDLIQPLGFVATGLVVVGLGLNYFVARANTKSEKEK